MRGLRHQSGLALAILGVVLLLAACQSTTGHTLSSAVAPDPELIDRNGDPFRISSVRGRKVLLVAWASY